MPDPVKIFFSQGTLLIDAPEESLQEIYSFVKFDKRVGQFRARCHNYAPIVLALHHAKIPFEDHAKAFQPLELKLASDHQPRDYQAEALAAWNSAGGRGIVVMPTGAGKSFFAMMAIAAKKRPALIVVPTIDLMNQWATQLEKFFGQKAGMLGGGSKDIQPLTVSTYDSAVLQMEFIGSRFGMLVFDECHHLPGPVNRNAASMCIAPYRLGLTATPELDTEYADIMTKLIGNLVCEISIDRLEGNALAPYKTERIYVPLTEEEQLTYDNARAVYMSFVKENNIDFSDRNAWTKFIGLCARMPEGRKVMESYAAQKRIARNSSGKFNTLWRLIAKHRGERIIIFTAENESAYSIGRTFMFPVITHRTKASERKEMLDRFRNGEYPVLVTSKVLNEGVDVPEASVGIVMSGSASIREHVQRLGRILRAQKDKEAVLYELVSEGTSEMSVSRRRREHRAYKRSYTS